MKKTVKKLVLSREHIRVLTDLTTIRGGAPPESKEATCGQCSYEWSDCTSCWPDPV